MENRGRGVVGTIGSGRRRSVVVFLPRVHFVSAEAGGTAVEGPLVLLIASWAAVDGPLVLLIAGRAGRRPHSSYRRRSLRHIKPIVKVGPNRFLIVIVVIYIVFCGQVGSLDSPLVKYFRPREIALGVWSHEVLIVGRGHQVGTRRPLIVRGR